jgi:ABC-type transport system involved in multi-copper enzyme maturation permease subunit
VDGKGMVGPVLYQEMLLGGRRGRWHWLRYIYVAWLLIVLVCWLGGSWLFVPLATRRPWTITDLAAFSSYYLSFFLFQHFLLLALITPVLVAGAVTDEKWRGTLQYLLTTDLLPWEILLGKLTARVYQAQMLALIGLPLICFFGPFAGLDVLRVFGFLACTLLLLFGIGSLSLLASVWCRHTRDAVLSVFCIGAAAFLLVPLIELLSARAAPGAVGALREYIHPLYPLGQAWMSMPADEYLRRLGYFAIFWGGLGFMCLLVAGWRLRAAYVRQLEKSGRQKRLHWWNLRRPRLKENPLLWKERYVEGIAPLSLLRKVPTWLGVAVILLLTTVSSGWILVEHLPYGTTLEHLWSLLRQGDWEALLSVWGRLDPNYWPFFWQGWAVLLLTTLIVGIRCSGAVSGEREKQTWEALLLTPMETHILIRGKLWGIAGACVPYLLAYAVPALTLSAIGGWFSVFWVALLLVITVLGIFYVAGVGIYWSVCSSTSWRSLLATLVSTYVAGLVLWALLFGIAMFVAVFILIFLAILEEIIRQRYGYRLGIAGNAALFNAWYIGFCILLAISFVIGSWLLIRNAEYRVSVLERTKHWKDEPKYGFRGRRRRHRVLEEP